MSERAYTDSPRPGYSLRERGGIRHQPLRDNDDDATWTPIACGGGIAMPGAQRREPVNCPFCLAAAKLVTEASGFAPDTSLPGPRRYPTKRHSLSAEDYAA
jgi:hypothetical protein